MKLSEHEGEWVKSPASDGMQCPEYKWEDGVLSIRSDTGGPLTTEELMTAATKDLAEGRITL